MGEKGLWDDEHARSLVGKRVLVGLTYRDHDGAVVETVQYHGTIVDVNAQDGVAVSPVGLDELFWLPPDLRAFEKAPRGAYRLRSTGEVVLHPDLLCSWTVREPTRGAPTLAEAPAPTE